jgi:hypothetical protein
MKQFYDNVQAIAELYTYEPADSDTLRYINEHAQSSMPGPYRITYNGVQLDSESIKTGIYNEAIYDCEYQLVATFYWESPEQETWWLLKYS